ncbi:MAG: hypothetical protein ABI414_05185 [Devosia sp.]
MVLRSVSIVALCITGPVAILVALEHVDIMRFNLPPRLWLSKLEIERVTAGPDFTTCMRAPLRTEEVEPFLSKFFDQNHRAIVPVAGADASCDAVFWHLSPQATTIASENGPGYTSGAAVQDDYVYFWADQI